MAETKGSTIHWKDYLDSLNIEKDVAKVCQQCRDKQWQNNNFL